MFVSFRKGIGKIKEKINFWILERSCVQHSLEVYCQLWLFWNIIKYSIILPSVALQQQQLSGFKCYIYLIWLSDTELAKETRLFKSKFKAHAPNLPLFHKMYLPGAVHMQL